MCCPPYYEIKTEGKYKFSTWLNYLIKFTCKKREMSFESSVCECVCT